MKESLEQQTFASLGKLTEQLNVPPAQMTIDQVEDKNDNMPAIDASETKYSSKVDSHKGENKVTAKKRSWRKTKHTLRKKEPATTDAVTATKRKPRFFCQF